MKTNRVVSLSALVLGLSAGSSLGTVVFSNNAAPGDAFTNAGPSGAFQVVGATGWLYNNVRVNGVAGINNTNPRSGNGSAYLSTAGGNSKSDIEFLSLNGSFQPVAIGTLGSLSTLKYDWYRDGAGSATAQAHYNPAFRIYFDADGSTATTTDRGYLVYERAYNPNTAAVPTDQWITDDIYNFNGAGQSANLWMVNFGNANGSVLEVYNRDITDWLTTPNPNPAYPTLSANTIIYGVSMGIGSGWNPYVGAVDNAMIGFTGAPVYSWNFEVVPAPGAMALLGLGGLMAARRRRA